MTTIASDPVADFLAAVRGHLADLDPEELAEITDGLAADLAELVAERGIGALGDPAAYASELRSAAGLDLQAARVGRRSVGEAVAGLLDAVRRRAEELLDRLPAGVWAVLAWARPLWWILRGWIAVQVVVWVASAFFGIGYYEEYWEVVPSAMGWQWPLLAIGIGGSLAVGLGRMWPGGRRRAFPRTVLLALNALAILLVPVTLAMVRNQSEVYDDAYSVGYGQGYSEGQQAATGMSSDASGGDAGVYLGGRRVSNIYAYDASGKPLVGVQLFDQSGRPLAVGRNAECYYDGRWQVVAPDEEECWDDGTGEQAQARIAYPWSNGAAQLDNVFPLPSRLQESFDRDPLAFSGTEPPTIGELPFASVPPVSLPGITPSVQQAEEPPAPTEASTGASTGSVTGSVEPGKVGKKGKVTGSAGQE
ncbi:hypothetical protein [Nocardioides sp.]|uniref:hypothetical protein n=1 Tax=Nocardioides sp. TaxID=35761 RepID=UPI0039E29C43